MPAIRSRRASLGALLVLTGLALVPLLGTAAAGAPGAHRAPAPCQTDRPAPVDGHRWTCTFWDEFDGHGLDTSKWSPQLTSRGGRSPGGACLVAGRGNLVEGNGTLDLTARRTPAPVTCTRPSGRTFTTSYTAAGVSTGRHFSQTYGRFEIRAAFPAGGTRGSQSALWLYPRHPDYGPWPASGEIDIAEAYTDYPGHVVPGVHYLGDSLDLHHVSWGCTISDVTRMHTYALVWTPRTMTFEYDGQRCLTDNWRPLNVRAPAPFDRPFSLLLNQGVGVNSNSASRTSDFPATTRIDYVRVWK